MAQETRKDPRAKVLTMTVRYKSATLDEFIEHHSHDVSRGGMFIKTPSPFPPGTLLKFEVRISGDQRVMQGVGRVVWKREAGEVHDGAPAGMGVKFIKIDDASRTVIDQLVTRSGGAISAFERGGSDSTATPIAAQVAPKPATEAPTPVVRKSTMMGLGAMGSEAPEPIANPPAEAATGFFPAGRDGVEEPAPEDRTVMKQAAELLQDALREAGG
ncbi:MAG TPA: TIGR02266 family protein, partial [Polyangiaceae bacterium]|nr:TIGR02266 family protein [Polyangiaceae bacterium]